ncbi:MAG: 1,4-alpha-glucan branching protein GlgB [Lachnospiraceae bacterium]|jgi:1,4-alpha-glucan branching enzyme|nr:1,4-alpha-glucan branching protein GlgB [Lachnospiraceae bacterium]
MEQQLYDLMDWPEIEAIVYSECAHPERLLGPRLTGDGLLVQAFAPTAVRMGLRLQEKDTIYEMEKVDEGGYFAALVPWNWMDAGMAAALGGLNAGGNMADTGKPAGFDKEEAGPAGGVRAGFSPDRLYELYRLDMTYDNGDTQVLFDGYAAPDLWAEDDLTRFGRGIHYNVYGKMGAHPATLDGVSGVYFSVWAPEAMRVSVVGDFNFWDGRRHPMKQHGDSGVYELFVPGLAQGDLYKFEIKTRLGEPMPKSDPYGFFSQLRPDTASVVWDIDTHIWQDGAWMEKRKESDASSSPMWIYEVHLGSWMRKEPTLGWEDQPVNGSEFYNYRELAEKLSDYVLAMGYTHVELLPVMEHPLDASWGYQVTGYYAPTSRYGTPADFQYFMDYMHQKGIGVILDWVPAHFPKNLNGLACFDGTCVYEHKDPRQGVHPHWGTLIYNYRRPQVSNFLIANAIYWADKYHADGIRMDAVASMLYLDYGKNQGEWIPNEYGGHENLDAIEFLKHLNSVFSGRKDGALLIAEESTAWPQVTGDVRGGGLGFDFKWNMGWMNDFLGYMRYDPYFRSHHYGELTFSFFYAYSEKYMLVLSHDEVVHGKGSMAGKMPGDTLEMKMANLRAAYGFLMAHPGKKLLFMGQDFAQIDEWNENRSLEWGLLQFPIHAQMKDFVQELCTFYRSHPALYELDHHPDGFEWINCDLRADNMLVFLRKGKSKGAAGPKSGGAAHEGALAAVSESGGGAESAGGVSNAGGAANAWDAQTAGGAANAGGTANAVGAQTPGEVLLVVCNFAPIAHEHFRLGVPFEGKYKEIFYSGAAKFGGYLGDGESPNPRVKMSKAMEWDNREESIEISVKPLGIHVFSCTPQKRPARGAKAVEREPVVPKAVKVKPETVKVVPKAGKGAGGSAGSSASAPRKSKGKPETATVVPKAVKGNPETAKAVKAVKAVKGAL